VNESFTSGFLHFSKDVLPQWLLYQVLICSVQEIHLNRNKNAVIIKTLKEAEKKDILLANCFPVCTFPTLLR
jgi:hypothetical protein